MKISAYQATPLVRVRYHTGHRSSHLRHLGDWIHVSSAGHAQGRAGYSGATASTSICSRRTWPRPRRCAASTASAWRPHAKCHKSPDIGRRLIEAGAIGLTCAKLGEAEMFAAAGIAGFADREFHRRAAKGRAAGRAATQGRSDHLPRSYRPGCADQPGDAGMPGSGCGPFWRSILAWTRAGVRPGKPAVELAKSVAELPGIELVGVMGYEGHLLTGRRSGRESGPNLRGAGAAGRDGGANRGSRAFRVRLSRAAARARCRLPSVSRASPKCRPAA